MKKIWTILLAVAMMLPLAACTPSEGNIDTDGTKDQTEAEVTTVGETEKETFFETNGNTELDEHKYDCGLPENLSFGGKEIGILYVDGRESELISTAPGNGVVSDAVYERNLAVENRLGVKFVFHRVGDGTATASSLEDMVGSGDTTAEIFTLSADLCMTPVTRGAYVDLNGVEHVDLSKMYWCRGYNDMMTLQNKQFVVSSPAAVTLLQLQYSTLFNRTLLARRGLPDLYDVVDSGDWTLDYQLSLAQDVYEDTDGNGKESKYDFYGFVTGSNVSLDGYCVGASVPLISHDAEGKLYYSGADESVSERFSALNEKVSALYNVHGTYVCANNYIMSKFAFDECLMSTALFSYVESCIYVLDDMNFGMAPLPKLTKEQTAYRTYVEGANTTFGISAAVTDDAHRDMLGAVMEAMAYYSNELVRPAYYEHALPESFLQDARSRKALDDLYENIAFDYCFVENVGELRNTLRGVLPTPNAPMDTYQKQWKKTVKNGLVRYMRDLDELQ